MHRLLRVRGHRLGASAPGTRACTHTSRCCHHTRRAMWE